MPTSFSISGGTIATPSRVPFGSPVRIEGDSIADVGRSPSAFSQIHICVPNSTFVSPALLNIHDHIRGNYLPRVEPSSGRFYTDWNDDLHGSDTVAELTRAMSTAGIYTPSSYENIPSGAATVQNHLLHEWNEPFVSRQPLTTGVGVHNRARCFPLRATVGKRAATGALRGRSRRYGHSSLTSMQASMPRCWQAWTRWSDYAVSTITR